MFPISRKNKIILNYILVLILVFFSFAVNWNYAKYGIFPIDTFLHYDSGYRILKNEIPIRDFWIVSGFMVDFIQALFFKLFHDFLPHRPLIRHLRKQENLHPQNQN